MALRNKSIVTVKDPQFINLEPNALNPCISECEIKVMYLGKNRNGSYMDKQAAINMANTLPGTPIVAAYHEETEDFGDHGDVIHIENGEITFTCATVPYGFVSPDAKVWFQEFVDTDEFGNETSREYMMTTGYLWTGQYPEITKCITEGQGQSMELDDVDGHWATDSKSQVDFFIINDATITKLCVLGDKVEPCFEGASVTDLDVSKEFSMEKNFNQTLFSMMKELKNALENEGGSNMPEEIQETEEVVEAPAETEALEEQGEDSAEFASDKKEEDEEGAKEEGEEKPTEEEPEEKEEEPEEEEKPKKDHSLEESESVTELVEKFEMLKQENESLKAELETLRSFKLEREIADKDMLIAKYHMLSEEDKAEVEAHKAEYSLEEIESKLALIYVQKNVDFSTVDGTPETEIETPTSFTLVDDEVAEETDFMLQALREAKKN